MEQDTVKQDNTDVSSKSIVATLLEPFDKLHRDVHAAVKKEHKLNGHDVAVLTRAQSVARRLYAEAEEPAPEPVQYLVEDWSVNTEVEKPAPSCLLALCAYEALVAGLAQVGKRLEAHDAPNALLVGIMELMLVANKEAIFIAMSYDFTIQPNPARMHVLVQRSEKLHALIKQGIGCADCDEPECKDPSNVN